MQAGELLQEGRLQDALAAANDEVKQSPGDVSRRALLFSLLCFEGNLERARKQLDVIDAQAAMTEVPTYVNLLAAEETRRHVLGGRGRPKFLKDPPARLEQHLLALAALAADRAAEAHALLVTAEEARPETPGSLNGVDFDDIADADDVTRSVIEFMQGRDYFWVPFEQLAHLQVVLPDPPRPQDLLWAPCQLISREGTVHRGFTSVLYAGSHQAGRDSLKLGHETTFHDAGGGVFRGSGRKQFVAGEADPTVLELADVTFA